LCHVESVAFDISDEIGGYSVIGSVFDTESGQIGGRDNGNVNLYK